MNRRQLLKASLAAVVAPAFPALAQAVPVRTRWNVMASEGADAIAFLGPLSGGALYMRHYAEDVAAFAPKLPPAVRADVPALWEEARKAGLGLMGPTLQNIMSGGNIGTLDALIAALHDLERQIRPSYAASEYWKEPHWAWVTQVAPRLAAIFEAMRTSGFAAFKRERIGDIDRRIDEVKRALSGFDVIRLQEKLTGRTFDPEIRVVLLHFSKPHGIKVQGQTFLQSADYDIAITVRNAAHEMLHPPFPMDGQVAKAALAVLAKDPLFPRIVRDHDPQWGYTTLEGYLNEDMTQALDQLISEALGVARNPADRWRKADDGIHVLAAGFYGLLRQDKWVETGGSIEKWLDNAVRSNRLAPAVFHAAAARVLERPVDRLWPLTPVPGAKPA